MIGLICKALSSLLSILPNSWVQDVVNKLDRMDAFLGFLNFFIPFDVCAGIFQIWLGALVAFLLYTVAADKLWKLLL